MKVRVTGPYQVAHRDKVYVTGDTFEAPEGDARTWMRRGYVEEVKERKAEPKAQQRSENKAQESSLNKAASPRDKK